MKLNTTKTDEELIGKWKPVLDYTDDITPAISVKDDAFVAKWLEACEEEYHWDKVGDADSIKLHAPNVRRFIAELIHLGFSYDDISVLMEKYPFCDIDEKIRRNKEKPEGKQVKGRTFPDWISEWIDRRELEHATSRAAREYLKTKK